MAERTMTVHRLRFREKHDSEGETRSPADLNGESLIDIFFAWCESNKNKLIEIKDSNNVILISAIDSSHENALIVSVNCGKTGEPEKVYDPLKGVQTYAIQENEAALSYTRAVLLVPPRGENALFFTEQCARSRGANILLRLFDTYFRHYSDTIYLDNIPVVEGRAWVEASKALKKVEVQVYNKSRDRAERENEEDYYYSFSKFAKKNKTISQHILHRILDNPDFAESVVGMKNVDVADGEVEKIVKLKVVGSDGRSKEYRVGSDVGATIREVLNGDDVIMLNTKDLLERCLDAANSISDRLRFEWNEGWFRIGLR